MKKEEEKKAADWEADLKQHKLETKQALRELIEDTKRDADK
jgi:hypothetical protein